MIIESFKSLTELKSDAVDMTVAKSMIVNFVIDTSSRVVGWCGGDSVPLLAEKVAESQTLQLQVMY
jgi:hypothetical protein